MYDDKCSGQERADGAKDDKEENHRHCIECQTGRCKALLRVSLANTDDGKDQAGDAQDQRNDQHNKRDRRSKGIGIEHDYSDCKKDQSDQAKHEAGRANAVLTRAGGGSLLVNGLLVDWLLINRLLIDRLLVNRLLHRLLINRLLRLRGLHRRLRRFLISGLLLCKGRAAVRAERSACIVNRAVAVWALNHCHSYSLSLLELRQFPLISILQSAQIGVKGSGERFSYFLKNGQVLPHKRLIMFAVMQMRCTAAAKLSERIPRIFFGDFRQTVIMPSTSPGPARAIRKVSVPSGTAAPDKRASSTKSVMASEVAPNTSPVTAGPLPGRLCRTGG